jgi:NAD-specific glutamate dehydrogenase
MLYASPFRLLTIRIPPRAISTKVALSFRLKPDFLPEHEYPQPLYGMFLIISSEFRGFHLRFRDIARGGIRIVKSRNGEAYNSAVVYWPGCSSHRTTNER